MSQQTPGPLPRSDGRSNAQCPDQHHLSPPLSGSGDCSRGHGLADRCPWPPRLRSRRGRGWCGSRHCARHQDAGLCGYCPVVGAYADRLPRRVFLVSMDLVRAAIALLLPFVTEVWQVYVLIFLLQSASAAFTPTFQATIPDVLTEER